MKAVLASWMLLLVVAAAEDETYYLCGRQLANARTLVCFGSEDAGKRSGKPSLLTLLSQREWRWRAPERWDRSNALAGSWARGKRSIVDECCIKGCTMTKLMQYCP